VEIVINSMMEIAEDRKKAFRARIIHLNRLGFPDGIGTGRGNPNRYNAEQLFQLLAALELAQFNIDPQRAIHLLNNSWPELRTVVPIAHQQVANNARGGTVFWSIPTSALLPFSISYRGREFQGPENVIQMLNEEQAHDALQYNPVNYRQAFLHADTWAAWIIRILMGKGIVGAEYMETFLNIFEMNN